MKTRITFLLFILFAQTTMASHQMGGEITWQCLGPSAGANAGKYIFTVKFYRDCTGIPVTMGDLHVVNHPTISSLLLSPVPGTPNDISPAGCQYNCSNAASAPFGTLGLVQEYVWKTAPTDLGNFTPPAAGWIFFWTDCCRNTVNNIGGGSDMMLRAKMFSYNGLAASPCYDNSPAIAEPPATAICSGYPFQYAQTAFDQELDSVSYHWDRPMDGSTWPGMLLTYSAPYTTTNQMPGSPVLNSATGVVNYFAPPGTQGNFVTCVRVDEFRCGVKIAETYREIQVNLSSSCAPVLGGNMNTPPFAKDVLTNTPITGYTDTVNAGDTVHYQFSISDFDINASMTIQQITVEGLGMEFGSNDTGTMDCLMPPCATLSSPSPITFSGGQNIIFDWVTSCSHVSSITGCYQSKSLHEFVIRTKDDYCPLAGRNNYVFDIVVLGPQIVVVGNTLTTTFPNGMLQWYFNGVAIPGATTSNCTMTAQGVYSVSATINGGCQVGSPKYSNVLSSTNENLKFLFDFDVAPNPSSGVFTASIKSASQQDCFVTIHDISGRVVKQSSYELNEGDNNLNIDLSAQEKGIYIMQVAAQGSVVTKRLVID